MKKTVAVFAAALFAQAAFAQGIETGEAYAYPTVKGMTQGGAFVNLTNTEQKDDTLVGAAISKKVAQKTELHTHINENGVMRMREVKDGIPLPAGATQELKRGSYHVMFFGLKKPLVAGDKFDMTLKFKHAKPKKVTVTVRPMDGGAANPHAAHGAAGHEHAHGDDNAHEHSHGSEGAKQH